MTVEWNIPAPGVPVRQGDFLIARDPRDGRIDSICLVITADCDISKGKFGRQLACLRIIPLREYISEIWAAKKLRKAQVDELKKLRDQIAKWHSVMRGEPSSLAEGAVVAWIKRDDSAKICADLQVPEADRKKLVSAIEMGRSLFVDLESQEFDNALVKYIAFRSLSSKREINVCEKEVMQQAQREPLPDDVFLLPSLPQIESCPAVVLLREIVAVAFEYVCYRSADAVSNEWFLRVGRLEPTFKYAISQAFGGLYSRIGLPEDYELRCKEVIDGLNNVGNE